MSKPNVFKDYNLKMSIDGKRIEIDLFGEWIQLGIEPATVVRDKLTEMINHLNKQDEI